jgi:predicted dehydrogenase
MSERVRIGIIGCGNISETYLDMCRRFAALEVAACADMLPERAQARAAEFGVGRACSVEDLLGDPTIDIVVNLTIPKAHAEVALAAIAAGKSVYNEKPLAVSRQEGEAILTAAADRGVRVGCAPDTFLGGGLQTCRKLLDDGLIGEPVAAAAHMTGHGHEHWHPDPDFYYQPGGGPMFDMGPYYLTALVSLLGPIRRVTGSARASFAERTITSQPRHGQTITVRVPTHVQGVLDFASGAIGTITTSFDVWAANLPRIEIYGTEGSLSLPDPNGFGGPVRLWRADAREWREVPLTHPYTDNWRGLGVADMAGALRSGRPHRANGAIAYHVLEAMEAIHVASVEARHVTMGSACERPAAMPEGLAEGSVDR